MMNYLEEVPECPKLSKKEQDDVLFLMELYFREYSKAYEEFFRKKLLGENYKEIPFKNRLKKERF